MEVIFSPQALEDINYWKKTGNIKIQERIGLLIQAIQQNKFTGTGKPEPLKHNFSGLWSRRITREHRILYEIKNGRIHILSLKNHY